MSVIAVFTKRELEAEIDISFDYKCPQKTSPVGIVAATLFNMTFELVHLNRNLPFWDFKSVAFTYIRPCLNSYSFIFKCK
jgi:hypothetical protein